jgi:nucleoside-diphosphate-sugar epimerase
MTWDQFYRITAQAAGAEAQIVHIASDFLGACLPDTVGSLIGDKSSSVVFDNSKIKLFVPEFRAKVPFAEGIKRTIDWFDADPRRKEIDEDANASWDKLIDAYENGLEEAVGRFR